MNEAQAGSPGADAPVRDAAERFSDRVDDYVRFRPTYPPQMFEALATEWGLHADHVIADLGSGTGILTQLLLQRGHVVFAIEPNEAMRRAAEARLSSHSGFRSVASRAEQTGLADASVDWVMAAQAFHWFDVPVARRECVRILRSDRGGGRAALIWNNRREDTPFLAAYEAFLHEFGIDYAAVKHQNAENDGRIAEFFGGAGFAVRTFAQTQRASFDGVVGRTASCSYMPSRDHPRYAAMVARLRRLFEAYEEGGEVAFEYQTRLFVGRLV